MSSSQTPGQLSPEYEAAIRDREQAATPGPWCTDSWEIYQGAEYMPGISYWIGETCRADEANDGRADAAFVAHARDDVPALLAEIDRLRAGLAGLRQGSERWAARCDHIAKQGLRWKAEADGRKAHGKQLAAELEKLRTCVTKLEKAAVEARAALGSLCYDLEDPGTAALGALHLISHVTVWTEAGPDFAATALARRDADKLDAAAESIVAACPDHGDEGGAWSDCHCAAAEELNRQAAAARKGGA